MTDSSVPQKRCTKCGKTKPLTEFHKAKNLTDGHKTQCKLCRCSYQNAFRIEHHDEDLAKKREYHWANRERMNAISREYHATHREELSAKAREYRQTERYKEVARKRRHRPMAIAKKREYDKNYRAENPEKRREMHRKYAVEHVDSERLRARKRASERRAQVRSSAETFTIADVKTQLRTQGGRCWWCGVKLKKYHIDHRVPLIRGGSNGAGNICLACPNCNLSKGAKLPHEWNGRLL